LDQTQQFYLHNLDLWIDAIAVRADSAIYLDHYADGTAPDERHCAAGVLAHHPWFRALGVEPGADGAPVMRGPDGKMMATGPTLSHLVGDYGRWKASSVLAAPYGAGRWDAALRAEAGGALGHKALALARLHRARRLLVAHSVPIRGCGLHPVEPGDEACCANLQRLIGLLEGPTAVQLSDAPCEEDVVAAAFERLAAALPDLGRPGAGAPTAGAHRQRAHGSAALNRAFGYYYELEACDVLFAVYGKGPWDREILRWWGGAPSQTELALARLYMALTALTGLHPEGAPRSPRRVVRDAIVAQLAARGWTGLADPGIARKSYRTAAGDKMAFASLSIPDEYHYRLSGDYQSEGANALGACGVLIPMAADGATVAAIAQRFAVEADAMVARTYAVRLLG